MNEAIEALKWWLAQAEWQVKYATDKPGSPAYEAIVARRDATRRLLARLQNER